LRSDQTTDPTGHHSRRSTGHRSCRRAREGDANVRAVWLFSRNDAVANVAVIGAAGLVAWTGSAWPDLAVAAVIALLFLHSAYEILRGARAELREHSLAA
ncbi:cation transporter, partial [Sphingomonas fennica]|uniref:cation transporter n=1 Tax=Edaphosphingomonas fennica TaxID=114404 RepID=UPI0011B1DDB2